MGDDVARFWSHVDKSRDCWVWTGMRNHGGYGRMKIASRGVTASRYSWELHHGPIPDGSNVCHRCDNPPCVRPDHLFLGGQLENIGDANAKHRLRYGERHPQSRLSDDQRAAIVSEYRAGGVRQVDLAARYGVTQTVIGRLVRAAGLGRSSTS